jgi:putative hemolysin
VSGAASADLRSDRLGMSIPADRDYSTVAGFALWVLKRIPETGETFRFDNFKFEIVDMDGRKIDKLLVKRRSNRRSEQALESGSADER